MSDSVGLFGMLCTDVETDDAFNLFDLITGHPRTVPLSESSVEARVALRAAAPSPEAWFPSLILSLPSAECVAAGSEYGLGELVDGIVDWSSGQKLAAVAFPYLRSRDTELGAVLGKHGFTKSPITFTCELHLPGTGFDDYLANFTKHRRQSIRREIRVVEESGVEIRKRGLGECLDELVGLRLSLKRKYGRTPNEPKENRTFAGLMDNFSEDELHLLTAEVEGSMIGFGLDLIWNGVWHGLLSGTNYDDPRSKFVSFELDFYSPFRRAYEMGIKEFQLGIASWDAKQHRGADLVPMDMWTLPLDPALQSSVESSAQLTELAGAE